MICRQGRRNGHAIADHQTLRSSRPRGPFDWPFDFAQDKAQGKLGLTLAPGQTTE